MHSCPICDEACYCGGDIDDIDCGDEEAADCCDHCDECSDVDVDPGEEHAIANCLDEGEEQE